MAAERDLTAAKELVARAEQRMAEQRSRTDVYERYLAQYFQERAGEGTGGAAVNNYADGRPALRAAGETASGKSQRAAPNYIKPIIKDLVAIRGAWPQVTVPPASGDDKDRELSVLITRALRQQHDHSSMVIQQQGAGFFLACLGDACYTADPRTPAMAKADPDPFKPVGVYFKVVNPGNAFPEFMEDRPGDLEDLFLVYMVPRHKVKAQFPGIKIDTEEDRVQVIHYYSRSERQTVVHGTRAFGIRHDLGFCPAEWASNEVTDGHWAQADIAGTVDLHEELQDIWKVYVDSLIGSVYPIYHIHHPSQTQGVLEYGPGAQFTTEGDATISVLAPQANPQAARLIFDAAMDNLMKQTGIAPIRLEGQIDRSNVSARSVDRQQAPMEQRLKQGMALLGVSLQRLNSKALLMLSTIPELRKAQMELYGEDKDGIYRQTFSGADLGGWTRNLVKWDSLTGTTQEQRTLQSIQLYKEAPEFFPFSMALERSGFDDTKEIMERGKAEFQERLQIQQQAQQQMQPPGAGQQAPGAAPGGPPNPDQAHLDQMSLAGGGPGGPGGAPTQPPPTGAPTAGNGAAGGVPGFPPVANSPAAPGMGNPATVPNLEDEIRSALAGAIPGDAYQLSFDQRGVVIEVDAQYASRANEAKKKAEAALGIRITVVTSQAAKR